MTLTAPVTATGSTLVTVHRHQGGDWQQALASLGRRLPVGWDVSGERSGGGWPATTWSWPSPAP